MLVSVHQRSMTQSCRVAFVGAGTPYALVFAFVAYHYQGHDMTSCCWLVMGSKRFASPIMGIFCGGLNAYCMRIWPLFLRTSGSSGVLKALLLERNRQLSCNPKKKKKDFWGVLKLAERQGPQYDFGGVSTFVVPQSHFGIDPHCSDQH